MRSSGREVRAFDRRHAGGDAARARVLAEPLSEGVAQLEDRVPSHLDDELPARSGRLWCESGLRRDESREASAARGEGMAPAAACSRPARWCVRRD